MNTTAVVPPVTAITPAAAEQSAVSWGAILAGAASAAALSLILLILGMGLGLSSVSPWSFEGISREAFGWSTIVWLTLTAIAASGLGGYLAGRLRTRWVHVHTDETYFRDTAHGFLSWAVATLLTAAVLTSAIGAILGTGAKAVGSAAGAVATTAGTLASAGAGAGVAAMQQEDGDLPYWVDSMLRRVPAVQAPASGAVPADATTDASSPAATPATATATAQPRASADASRTTDDAEARTEIAHILANGLRQEALEPADRQYLAQRIAERTGMSQAEAEARVTDVETRLRGAIEEAGTSAREAADEARKASAYAALWLFITLLIGAFSASLFATFGGRRRDL